MPWLASTTPGVIARTRSAAATRACTPGTTSCPTRRCPRCWSAASTSRRCWPGGDDLYQTSLITLSGSLSGPEKQALVEARDAAVSALHAYAAWLEEGIPRMAAFVPMGRANYDLYLRRVHLLPFNAEQVEMLGQAELNRYRGLESLLADPSLASPDPARAKNVPADQQAFLAAYQGREKEMIEFLQKNRLITLPAYLGPVSIRQLPDAFKPTSPGGFMNPPGLYDKDPEGFYFIPTYNPKSENFYKI